MSADYPSFGGRFYGVAATSADDVWAVGISSDGGQIAHWNGRSWSDTDFPAGYQAVAAQSPTDVWAVGGTSWFDPTQALAEHWNAKTWTLVPTATPDGSAWFNAVAATSPTNAWAVGCTCGGPGDGGYSVPLIEHWDGKTWKEQFFPLPKHTGFLSGVAATGPRDAWAVGTTGSQAPNSAILEHWNGYRWRRVDTPPGLGVVQGVTMISPDDVWAVGFNGGGPTWKSLILHYNGKRWSVVPSLNPTGDTDLTAVGSSGPDDVWAVGYLNPTTCNPQCTAAIFRWNGKRWSYVPSPNPGGLDALEGVVAVTPSDAWAVGTANWGSTIIEHWNGKTWST